MAFEHNESLPFKLPEEDVKRQAVAVWRGFEYQLLQTLHAWLRLAENSELYLEVAEDLAVLDGTSLAQTQIKDLSANISLRSDPAHNLIESHWRLVEANPSLNIVSTLLTTAKAAKEEGVIFADNKAGLEHWRVAARDGTNVDSLRKFLLTCDFSNELKTFIQASSDEDFRNRLLRPIKWFYGSGDVDIIRQTVEDALVCLGDRYSLLATESLRTRDLLLAELRSVILKQDIRKVNRARLLKTFEAATHVSVPRAMADDFLRTLTKDTNQVAIDASTGVITDVSRMPLPPRVAPRQALLSDLSAIAAAKGVLWLHGSSGLGKTTLALMIGKLSNEPWLFVDLRGCSVREVKLHLATAGIRLASGTVRGVIVDDYPVDEGHANLLGLALLRVEAHAQDAVIVVTTTRVPSPSLVSRLGDDEIELIETPYLSKEDVRTLITEAGGDSERWTEVVHLFSGGGHPQLVDAKVASLRSKDWAESELLKDMGPFWASNELQAERDAVSVQLPKLLPENALELLYRLSLLLNGFDKQLALAVGNSKEPVKRPGEALTLLVGPWVERRGEDKYALSPLVSSCGATALSGTQQSSVRKAIVHELMQRRPFPAEHLTQLFLNAYAEKTASALLWFAEAMQLSAIRDRSEFKMLAAEVSVILTALSVQETLFAEENYVAAMLRITQCFVALETDLAKFPAIFDRMIAECRLINNTQVSAGLLAMSIFKTLSRQGIGLSPKTWFPLIIEFPRFIENEGSKWKSITDIADDNPHRWSIDQFLFVIQSTCLLRVDWLVELMGLLDDLQLERRNYFLSALNREVRSRKLTVDNAWVNQAKVEELDGIALSQQYKEMSVIAESWNETDLQIDCICAQAVLLDEYADCSDQAVAVLDQAIEKLGDDHRLLRRRQVVYVNQGKHKEALGVLHKIVEGYSVDPIDSLYTLRDAGRSAYATGDLTSSYRYFCEAADAAKCVGYPLIPMTAGLHADAAFVAFAESNYANCLNQLTASITLAETVGENPTNLEKFCLIVIGQLLNLMLKEIENGNLNVGWLAGICSNPSPREEVYQSNVPPPMMLWYQLAILEVKAGVRIGVLEKLRSRLMHIGRGLFSFESMLSHFRMEAAIKHVNVDEFMSLLPEFVTLGVTAKPQGDSLAAALAPIELPIIHRNESSWNDDEKCLILFENTLIAFALQSIACDEEVALDELLAKLGAWFPPSTKIGSFLGSICEIKSFSSHGLAAIGSACVSNMREGKMQISADMALGLTYYVWSWIVRSEFKTCIEDRVADCISSIWRKIITENRLMLNNPLLNVSQIELVLEGPTRGTERLATLALETESATSSSLNDDIRKQLRDFLKR